METVIISGGTGLIGTGLTKLLTARGFKVIILSRRDHAPSGNVSYAMWDLKTSYIDPEAIKKPITLFILQVQGWQTSDGQNAAKKKLLIAAWAAASSS